VSSPLVISRKRKSYVIMPVLWLDTLIWSKTKNLIPVALTWLIGMYSACITFNMFIPNVCVQYWGGGVICMNNNICIHSTCICYFVVCMYLAIRYSIDFKFESTWYQLDGSAEEPVTFGRLLNYCTVHANVGLFAKKIAG